MRRTVGRIVVLIVLVLWAIPCLAQTADEVIEKHLAASGGRAALANLTSRVSTGSIRLTSPVGELAGTIDVYTKKPNKARTLIKLDLTALGAGQVVQDQRFDGTSGYVIDTINGNHEIAGAQLEAVRNARFPTPLLDYKEQGLVAELTGEETIDGKSTYVVRLTPKSGPAMRMFFDRETFMLVRAATTLNVPQLGGDIEQVVDYSDFRDVDGVKVPFTTRSANQLQTVVATLTSVMHNVNIDDSSFERPAAP